MKFQSINEDVIIATAMPAAGEFIATLRRRAAGKVADFELYKKLHKKFGLPD